VMTVCGWYEARIVEMCVCLSHSEQSGLGVFESLDGLAPPGSVDCGACRL
jgi:hypothetical protein